VIRKLAIRWLHWGCERITVPGWINSDRRDLPGVDVVCDIRDGHSPESGSIDYAVSIHALPEVPYPGLTPVVWELRRVLQPNGVLRLVFPDLDTNIQAYLRNERDYFLIADHEFESIGGKFIFQLLWYGYSRTLFTHDFIEELLLKGGVRSREPMTREPVCRGDQITSPVHQAWGGRACQHRLHSR
jgi:predicted SAM-dependent methyltransferase